MSIVVPGMLGIVLKKNEITKQFIEKEIELFRKFVRDKEVDLNEDQHLIGFSVAMNGSDLAQTIEDLINNGAIEGKDFVATSSVDGVIGETPEWLRLEVGHLTGETNSESEVKRLHYAGRVH